MAEQLETKDESTTNPCCSEWKDRLLKVQQKCKKTEDARAALKKAVGLYERQFTLMQDDILKLKKASEEEKLQTDNARKDKEKESSARALLEKEISTLKSELLSSSQKEGSVPEHVNEELTLLRKRVSDSEKEIKRLQEQLQKEASVAAKAVEEKKRADEALESSKDEKSKTDKDLSNLKAQLRNMETERKQLKKDLKKEKARADSEKKRTEEALKTAKSEQDEAEASMVEKKMRDPLMDDQELSILKAQLLNMETEREQLKKDLKKERARADSEKKRAEEALKTAKTEQDEAEASMAEKKMRDPLMDELSSLKSEMETEISRLKEVLDKEKRRADSETKKTEAEKKNANKLREMVKAEQSRADEQRKLVDFEKKKAEEFSQQLQKLKSETDEARSKFVLEGSKLKEANKKLEAERKKFNKEKKKSEELQKIVELSMKNSSDEKKRADLLHQQLEECKQKYVKLQKEMQESVKQKTKDTKQRSEKIQDLVSSRNSTDPSCVLIHKDTETKMKLLKKRLKLEKERVKHYKKVSELEKKCKKTVEEELHRLKVEFARFSTRVGLCSCFPICNTGKSTKSCLEKNGNVNTKREFMQIEGSGKELVNPVFAKKLNLDGCVPSSVPVSGTCTESTSGTASKLEPLPLDRKKVDSSALVSSVASFSDQQGKTKKRKRLLNAIQCIEHLYTEGKTMHEKIAQNMSALHGILGHVDKEKPPEELPILPSSIQQKEQQPETRTVGNEIVDLNAFVGGKNVEIFDGDYMKLLNLDNEILEERYRAAVDRPLSPTLPNIEFENNVLEASRLSEVDCSNGLLPGVSNAMIPCSLKIVVFPEIKDSCSLSKIYHTTRSLMSDNVMKNVVSALSAEENFSPKEKICVFFSLFLKSSLGVALTEVNHVLDENFFKTIDIFSGQIKKVMSEVEIRTMFTKVCNLDELIALIQDFIINQKVLIQTDINSETLSLSESKPSFHELVIAVVLLASVCLAFDRIDSIREASYTFFHIASSSTSTFLHVFAYVCGEKLLSAPGDENLVMTVISSLVTDYERVNSSFCAKCPFLIGAVSMEEIASVLLKRLSNYSHEFGMTAYKSTTVSVGVLSDLGDVLSLLELLASKMKWGWVCENIISQLLKLMEVFFVETPLTAVFVLLGQMARIGIEANGFEDPEVDKIRVKLTSFISTGSKTSLPVQFAAVNSLLRTTPLSFQEICKNSSVPPTSPPPLPPPVSCSSATDCIQKWFSLLSDEQKVLSARLFLTAGVS